MKKNFFRSLVLIVLVLPSFLTFFAQQNKIQSAPVTNIKDQLSTAQLSYFGRLVSASGSIIKVALTGNPSNTTANLSAGDTLAIASGATSTTYIVNNIGDTASIELASAIGTTTTSSYVVATRSATHTVTFTPQSSTAGEKWQFLIKATNRVGENPSDGMPDQTGFDLGGLIASDITCPLSGTASVGTTINITSGVSVGSTGIYHVVTCTSGATSVVGTPITMIVGGTHKLINPAPGINHTEGQADSTADTYTFAIRQLDSANNIIDTTFGKIAATENVRVTAIVDPTITFTIGTSNTSVIGTVRCGSAVGNGASNSTPTSVSFGPLVLGTFNNLAQSLHITTNSTNGYIIQAFENRPMTMLGGSTTIPDTVCETQNCTTTSSKTWTAYTNSGFGYALEVGSTSTGAILGITTASQYKPFGIGSAAAQTILSRTNTPSGTDSVYVCYRVTASTIQPAGTYENSVSYIATATF